MRITASVRLAARRVIMISRVGGEVHVDIWKENGTTMKRLLLFSVLSLLAALAMACDDSNTGSVETQLPAPQAADPTAVPTPEPTATPTPEPTPTPALPSVSAAELLETSVAALLAAESFHFVTDVEISFQSETLSVEVPISVTGDFQAPDDFHATMAVSLIFLVIDTEIISKDGTTYLKDPASDQWIVIPGGLELFSDPMELVRVEAASLIDLALAGVETLDGVDTFRLTATANAGTYSSSTGDFLLSFWIRASDGLLMRISAEGEILLSAEDSEAFGGIGLGEATVSIVLKLSEFGEEVDIQAPEIVQ